MQKKELASVFWGSQRWIAAVCTQKECSALGTKRRAGYTYQLKLKVHWDVSGIPHGIDQIPSQCWASLHRYTNTSGEVEWLVLSVCFFFFCLFFVFVFVVFLFVCFVF